MSLFCCQSIQPYRPQRLDHESEFTSFMTWARSATASSKLKSDQGMDNHAPYAVQLVRQINFGAQESIRYFIPNEPAFIEVAEEDMINANFEKLNSYKNFRCPSHNRFFEINLYQKNPRTTHHWRVNIARPAKNIDLASNQHYNPLEKEKIGEKAAIDSDVTNFPLLPMAKGSKKEVKKVDMPESQPDDGTSCTVRDLLRYLVAIHLPENHKHTAVVDLIVLEVIIAKFDLGMNLQSAWDKELNTENVLGFLNYCNTSYGCTLDLTHMKEMISAAFQDEVQEMSSVPTGRDRLIVILQKVLESHSTLSGVNAQRSKIISLVELGPDDSVFSGTNLCAQDALQIDSDDQHESAGSAISDENDDAGRYSPDYPDSYHSYDNESAKDFTACNKECGYCGKCDY